MAKVAVDWALDAAAVEAISQAQKVVCTEVIKCIWMNLDKHAAVIGKCDGESKGILREWLDARQRAWEYINTNDGITLELVGVLATGQLARIVATFIANNQPAQLTWAKVRAEIERLFMSKERSNRLGQG